MKINTKYDIGDIVYLKTDVEQLERIIIGITIVPNSLIYTLMCGVEMSEHYDFEISDNEDTLKKVT